MKRLYRIAIPILFLVLSAAFVYFYAFSGAFSPEDAVTGYIKASMKQDSSGMVRYSSDYQKTILFGSRDFTDSAIKTQLKKSYANVENIYKDSKITFSISDVQEISSQTDEYSKVTDAFVYTAGKADFSAVTKVAVTVYVDGKQKQKSTVYAVKCGLYWYYGYIE
ncbi:MAG TPA: hypothetical protein DD733_03885 [Clostridiales bacterium]|nr:hypothetical protein [Eubacteriales bacterium]HBR31207.1 hypothetical protein [Clostridiales bacterium]